MIEEFLRSKLKLFYKTSAGWVQSFCPFCNDEFRKKNPTHGHLYISPDYRYFLCFRCGISGGIPKLLNRLGADEKLISECSKKDNYNIIYDYVNVKSGDRPDSIIADKTKKFIHRYGMKEYKRFLKYLNSRSRDIDHFDYLLFPSMIGDKLCVGFMNWDGEIVTYRFIDKNEKRYIKPKSGGKYYYFTDTIYNIIEYSDIVICEGPVDLINLKRFVFCDDFFFISLQNPFFYSAVNYLCKVYLVVGNYRIHIVFDNDKIIPFRSNFKNVKLLFYKPCYGKDVSDLACVEEI